MADLNDIYNEIDRIDNAKQGIAEAIEEKGVQVPAGTPIQDFPGKVRQIQAGSSNAVLYTPQDLTPEQQEQARDNIGAYKKPGTGIPNTDLATGVQTSLEKADTALQPAALTPITELIPAQATPQNQLADKNFVNSSVATNTANYISDNGQPFQSVADLEAYTGPLTNNDYAFVVGTDSAGNTTYTRYKYNASTQTWAEEYVLNNSSFTAAQWAAISSGITALLVQKLSSLPAEVVTYVSQTLTEAQKSQARTNIGAGTYSLPANGIPKTDLAQAVRTSLNRADAAIIYTDLGEPNWEEYDYDISTFLTTLRTTGYYSFTMDEEFVYYVTVQAIEMGAYTYVYQQYFGSEEGPGSVYYRGFVYDNEGDEVVSDNDMSYMTIQQASDLFANKSHNHYTNVRDTASVWSYCDTMQTLDATSKVVYTDSTTSTQWLIEGAYSAYQPAVRYQKVTPLQGGTCFYQRCGTVASLTVTWGPWYRFDAVMPIASSVPQGGFLPNIVYDLGVLTGAVTFVLASPTDNSTPNVYHWTFDTGATAPAITWPSGLTWLDGSEPQMEASKHYEIMVRNGYATALVFSL